MVKLEVTLTIFITIIFMGFSQQFDPNRLRLVDSNQGHYFVRGNLPIRNNTFVFD